MRSLDYGFSFSDACLNTLIINVAFVGAGHDLGLGEVRGDKVIHFP